MKAYINTRETTPRELVAVILHDGAIAYRSAMPQYSKYPSVILRDKAILTNEDLEYWLDQSGSVGVYEGQSLTMQF